METKTIHQKLIEITREIVAIEKDKTNPQQGYKFRGIDDMYNALHPLFAKHGVFITSEIVDSKREERQTQKGGLLLYSIMTYKFTFWAEDGSNVSSIITGEAMDSGDKASNKAISAALKYALMQMFLIPTDDDLDTESNSPAPKAKSQPQNHPQQKESKLWLNEKTKEWEAALKFLDEGGSIADIEKKYAISSANKDKLINRTRKTNNE